MCFIRYSSLIHVEKLNCDKILVRDPFPLRSSIPRSVVPYNQAQVHATFSVLCILPASKGASPVPQRRIRGRERSFISHLIVRVVVVSSSSSTLLAHVLPTSAKRVNPSHTSCHTYQFLIILFWARDPFQCGHGRPTSTSPQSSSLEAIITRDTQVRAKMRGRRRMEEGRKGIDVRLSQMDTSALSKEGRLS